jgi:hypothetical protein
LVETKRLGDLELADPIFNPLKGDYTEFAEWAHKNNDRLAFCIKTPEYYLAALCVIKEVDTLPSILPQELKLKRGIKLCTFITAPDVDRRGLALRLMEEVLEYRLKESDNTYSRYIDFEYMYFTVKDDDMKGHLKLISFMEHGYGFKQVGRQGDELVFLSILENGAVV